MLAEMMFEECKNLNFPQIFTSSNRLSMPCTHGLQGHISGKRTETCSQGKNLTSDISLEPTDLVKSNTDVIY